MFEQEPPAWGRGFFANEARPEAGRLAGFRVKSDRAQAEVFNGIGQRGSIAERVLLSSNIGDALTVFLSVVETRAVGLNDSAGHKRRA